MSPRRALPVVLSLLALASSVAADVLLVGDGGGGEIPALTDAIALAADGDIILVRKDVHEGVVVIDGKSLTLVSDMPGDKALIGGPLQVDNVPAGGLVVVRGFEIEPFGFQQIALELSDCAGSVWIEDCRLVGQVGGSQYGFLGWCVVFDGGTGLKVSSCDSVTVVRCEMVGGPGWDETFLPDPSAPSPGGAGAIVVGSRVAFHTSMLFGGKGGDGSLACTNGTFHGDGGPGLEMTDSDVLLSGCAALGGSKGADGLGLGGDGAHLDATSTLEFRPGALLGGGVGGEDLDNDGGVVVTYLSAPRTFDLPSPLRENEAATLEIGGSHNDLVGFFWSFQGASVPIPGKQGWWHLGGPFLAGPFLLGTLVGSSLDIPFVAPQLSAGLEGQTFLLQPMIQDASGITLGPGTSLVLVDDAF